MSFSKVAYLFKMEVFSLKLEFGFNLQF